MHALECDVPHNSQFLVVVGRAREEDANDFGIAHLQLLQELRLFDIVHCMWRVASDRLDRRRRRRVSETRRVMADGSHWHFTVVDAVAVSAVVVVDRTFNVVRVHFVRVAVVVVRSTHRFVVCGSVHVHRYWHRFLLLGRVRRRVQSHQLRLGDRRRPSVGKHWLVRCVHQSRRLHYVLARVLRPVRPQRLPQVVLFARATVRQQLDGFAVQVRHSDAGRVDWRWRV